MTPAYKIDYTKIFKAANLNYQNKKPIEILRNRLVTKTKISQENFDYIKSSIKLFRKENITDS